jgi:hypothetical protein
MKYTRMILIVVAAILCVAVSGFAHDGPGMKHGTLVMGQTETVGYVDVHNTGKYVVDEVDYGSKLMVKVTVDDPTWAIIAAQSWASFDPVPLTKNGAAIPGQFNNKVELADPQTEVVLVYDLEDDLEFRWGQNHPHELKVAVHADLVPIDPVTGAMVVDPDTGEPVVVEGAWSWVEDATAFPDAWGWEYRYSPMHAMRGQVIDAPVKGLNYVTETHTGFTGDPVAGGFYFFPFEPISLYVGDSAVVEPFYIGTAIAAKKVSLLDMKVGSDIDDPWVIGAARTLQTLDSDNHNNGVIHIAPEIGNCFATVALGMGFTTEMFQDEALVDALLTQAIASCDQNNPDMDLDLVDEPIAPDEAQGNLEGGLAASGIFRKNVSKTEDWGETKQKLDQMPVYIPGVRSNGDPSFCDYNDSGVFDEGDVYGVPYEEWRLTGCDPTPDNDYCRCDPREVEDGSCILTIVECREVAKPLVVTFEEAIDIYDDQVTTAFWPVRFSDDIVVTVSRDDGTTWKRKNISRMAVESSFELETGEPFPGHCRGPVQKVDDNKILVVWTSTFCKSGNPRYSITDCVNHPEECEFIDGAWQVCSGNPDQGTQVCEPDYPYDDAYHVTDIWGVRGQQRSVNYDDVDDVADLGIGEIPFSCLWATRGVIVTQAELDAGKFDSLNVVDDPTTPDVDETRNVELGDIVWFKPERITSGRRDAYVPVVNSARGSGFAIAWQEDPDGLRPGKAKGPGQGWSGAITNHKTDIWYTYIRNEDFDVVDEMFVPGGPGGGDDGEPDGDEGYLDKPGLGRPKALVPFALPVRISDNDMVNTDTLKVELDADGMPIVQDGSFVPMDPETVANFFCDGPSRPWGCRRRGGRR